MKLIPSEGRNTANYWCSWRNQRLFMPIPYFHMRQYDLKTHNEIQREMLSDEFLFGKRGIVSCYMEDIRKDMYIMLDDGWDIPYQNNYEAFGSLELNEDRFPYGGKTPAENLAILSQKVKDLGYSGTGLWVPVQCIGETVQNPFTKEQFRDYWIARAKWLDEADIAYLKVDWGIHCSDVDYRLLLTDIFKQYAPHMQVEHTVVEGWFHDETRDNTDFSDVLRISDSFRLYDVRFDFNSVSTLSRAAALLSLDCDVRTDCAGLINVGEEPYIAAALGCTMGIMSHPLLRGTVMSVVPDDFHNGISTRATLKSEYHSFDHYQRALRWQRLAPAFSYRKGETICSQKRLEDTWTYQKEPYPYDANDLKGKTIRQSAPQIIARGTALPQIIQKGNTVHQPYAPYIVASKNRETGVYTVASLPRTIDGVMNYTTPLVSVVCTGLSADKCFAVFGEFESLTLEFDRPIEGMKLYGGDLLLDDHKEITSLAGVRLEGNRLQLDGTLLSRLGTEKAAYHDLSDPGSVFQLIETGCQLDG